MKKLMTLAIVTLFVAAGFAQEKMPESKTKIAVASYNGHSTEAYYFTNNVNERQLRIDKVYDDVLKKFDLNSDVHIDDYFRITYRTDYVKSDAKKDDSKLSKAQPAFKKVFTIIDMEMLEGYDDEEDDIDDGK